MKLNYDAEVPMLTGPFTVQVDASKPPGDRFRDYVPNPNVQPEVVTKTTRKDQYTKPVVRGMDFMSGEESSKRREGERSKIKQLAKEIYQQQAKKRQDYADAKKLVDSCTAEEIDKPTPQVERALRILRKTPPMEKSEVMQEAERQFYGNITEA